MSIDDLLVVGGRAWLPELNPEDIIVVVFKEDTDPELERGSLVFELV